MSTPEKTCRAWRTVRVVSCLREFVRARSLSAAEVARLADVPYEHVLRICNESWEPSVETAIAISESLELRVADLFRLEGD